MRVVNLGGELAAIDIPISAPRAMKDHGQRLGIATHGDLTSEILELLRERNILLPHLPYTTDHVFLGTASIHPQDVA